MSSKESEVTTQSVPSLVFDHLRLLGGDSEYAMLHGEYLERMKKRAERLRLVVKVREDEDIEGMVLGNRLNETGVRERAASILHQLADALREEDTPIVYKSLVDFNGLRAGGSLYPEQGIDLDTPISPSARYLKLHNGCLKLACDFRSSKGAVEPSADIYLAPTLNLAPIAISPSDVEMQLFCVEVLEKLAEVQKHRIESGKRSGVSFDIKLRRRILNIAVGRDACLLEKSYEILQILPNLNSAGDRVNLLKCLGELNSISCYLPSFL